MISSVNTRALFKTTSALAERLRIRYNDLAFAHASPYVTYFTITYTTTTAVGVKHCSGQRVQALQR
jgi:hypothetical protein